MHGLVTHRLVIARLKKRPGIWRVDGVGELRDRGRLGKHVTIHLAGINDEDINRAYVKDALNRQTFAVSIHSAQLLRFKTGSIWKDGKLLRFSPEISEECEINAGSGKIVSLGEKVQIHGFEIPQIIPQSHFLFGSDNTVDNREKLSSSKYVLLEAKTKMGNKWLIIPCTEILRFYFGVSSRLLSSTLAGELDTYFDFDKSGIENGRLKLHALKPLSRFEASVLGRTVASSDAKLAMNNVFNHLRSLHLNNTLKSPVDFP